MDEQTDVGVVLAGTLEDCGHWLAMSHVSQPANNDTQLTRIHTDEFICSGVVCQTDDLYRERPGPNGEMTFTAETS